MRLVVVIILAAVALLTSGARAEADGYTARQAAAIGLICEACARYEVDCTLPLAIARRESGYGANVVSQVDRDASGQSLSIGVYQWHSAGLGGYRGPGYEDDWRWDLGRDIARGVDLITSHLRGGRSYLSHWYTPRGLDTRNLPRCDEMSDAGRRGETVVGSQGEGLQTGDGLRRHPREQDR